MTSEPVMRVVTTGPRIDTTGMSAFLRAWTHRTPSSVTPLARAVVTYSVLMTSRMPVRVCLAM
jgi:hypothetical protein